MFHHSKEKKARQFYHIRGHYLRVSVSYQSVPYHFATVNGDFLNKCPHFQECQEVELVGATLTSPRIRFITEE